LAPASLLPFEDDAGPESGVVHSLVGSVPQPLAEHNPDTGTRLFARDIGELPLDTPSA